MPTSTTQSESTSAAPAESLDPACTRFMQAYPEYARTSLLDELRAGEYGRLDEQNHVYLDYTGGGLYADSQLRQHQALLAHDVFGNPHSHNPTSMAMTERVESARSYVLEFFNASPSEYVAIFTANCSAAIKLVGEAYPFGVGDRYLLTSDNHNSINGVREYARARGASFDQVPVLMPEMRIDRQRLGELLAQARPGANNLFAFPAQSNYSGVQHPLEMIGEAQRQGWDVMVDCAAFVPSNRLDLSRWRPDFVPISFYKMFGYPTGTGCLIARRAALGKLKRPWFAGGTITIASVLGDGHYLADAPAGFEDGTCNYLNIPAVEIGLRHIASIGIDTIHERVRCLTGWLLESLTALTHSNGRPLARIHGPCTVDRRGGTLSGNYLDRNGQVIDSRRVEELAGRAKISLRTGCFCNPGAGETALGLTKVEMQALFGRTNPMSFDEMTAFVKANYGKTANAVRISVGLVSNCADVQRFLAFVAGFKDKTLADIGEVEATHPVSHDQP